MFIIVKKSVKYGITGVFLGFFDYLCSTKRLNAVPIQTANVKHITIMKAIDATTLEKTPTLRDQYLNALDKVFTDESLKYLASEKAEALKNDKEYQAINEQLKARKVLVCQSVTNMAFCRMIAKVFGKKWGLDEDKLLSMIITKDGKCYRDGKPYLVSSVAQAASYAVYIYGTLTKVVKEKSDESDKVYRDYKGMRDLGMFTDEEITTKVCGKYGIDTDILTNIVNAHETN